MEAGLTKDNKCSNCGAALPPVVDRTATCHYCGSVFTITYPEPANTVTDDVVEDEAAIDDTEDYSPELLKAMEEDNGDVTDYSFLIPTRKAIFKKYMLRGFFIWLGYGVFRAILPLIFGKTFAIDSTYFDNILFSQIASVYWFTRAAICMLLFPLLMSTVFYGQITQKLRKSAAQR